jgi:hypothetical protein
MPVAMISTKTSPRGAEIDFHDLQGVLGAKATAARVFMGVSPAGIGSACGKPLGKGDKAHGPARHPGTSPDGGEENCRMNRLVL